MARKRSLIAVLAGLAALPGLAVAADTPPAAPSPPSPALLRIGAAYVAKQYCSCLFVTGRSEASCRPEFKPQIDLAKVEVDRSGLPERGRVSVGLGDIKAEATYSRDTGCVLAR